MLIISTNHELALTAYKDLRWNAIKAMEGVVSVPYLDTATPSQLTIGIGFNIEGNPDLRNRVYTELGLDGILGLDDTGKKGTHLFLAWGWEKGDAFIFSLKENYYAKEGKSIGAQLPAPYCTERAQQESCLFSGSGLPILFGKSKGMETRVGHKTLRLVPNDKSYPYYC